MGLKEYKFGFESENKAVKFLKSHGFEILERNFHSRFGEIDIIAKKDEILHFIEVKARTNTRYAYPQEAVCAWKRRRLSLTALYYLVRHPYLPYAVYLFDVAEVYLQQRRIRVLQNAFPMESSRWMS